MTPSATSFRAHILWGAAVAAVTIAAYLNSFHGAFVFDDDAAIVHNPSIRQLRSLGAILRTPNDGSPATGRPLTNLSFALNFAISGASTGSYHAANLAIHLGAALLLFGIVRRTLEHSRVGTAGWVTNRSVPLAAAAAALWAVHPLQTESVTYVAQRSEELMGLLYLAGLYGLVRAVASGCVHPTAWLSASVACCLLGATAKEVIVTAPLVILLYDRTFVSGTVRAALRSRRLYYAGLAATWLPLALLLFRSGSRGGTIGFTTGISATRYLVSQAAALARYLGLCLWPHPLVIDYGNTPAAHGLVVVGLLLAAGGIGWTVVGAVRNSASSFLGIWFFAILAPTSSVVPVASEVMAEHRLYLSLAAVAVAAVVVVGRLAGPAAGPLLGAAIVACTLATAARNRDYRSPLELWTQTVAAQPENAGAHNNRGAALLALGDEKAAAAEFGTAVALDPDMAGARQNLGSVLFREGRYAEAAAAFAEAVRLRPAYAEARLGLAESLSQEGRGEEALAELDQALHDGADPVKVARARALALLRIGRVGEAVQMLRTFVASHPADPAGHLDLGFGLEKAGDLGGAEAEYREGLRLDPASGDAAFDLANLLIREGRLGEGIGLLRTAISLEPARAEAYGNLGGALIAAGRPAEALEPCEQALRLQPGLVEAQLNLGNAFASLQRYPEAIAAYRGLLRNHPDYVLAHHNLAAVLLRSGDEAGARAELAAERQARAAQP